MVPWPSGKAKVCKTFIPQFESGWHLSNDQRKLVVFLFPSPAPVDTPTAFTLQYMYLHAKR